MTTAGLVPADKHVTKIFVEGSSMKFVPSTYNLLYIYIHTSLKLVIYMKNFFVTVKM